MWKFRLRLYCPFGGYGFLLLITALLSFMVIMGILLTTGKEILLSFLVFPAIFVPAFFLINYCNRSDREKIKNAENTVLWETAEKHQITEIIHETSQKLIRISAICVPFLLADSIGMIFAPEWRLFLLIPGCISVLVILHFLVNFLYWKHFSQGAEICHIPVDYYDIIVNRANMIDAVVMIFYLPEGKYKIARYPRFMSRTDTGEPYRSIYLIRTRNNIRWIPG